MFLRETFLYTLLIKFLMPAKEIEIEKIPAPVKRCPQCKALALEFDAKAGILKCAKCGFKNYLKLMR